MLFIYFKRFFKNPAFAAALVLMPATVCIFMLCFKASPSGINVGIAGSGHYTDDVMEVLENKGGNIKFEVYADEEALITDTAAGRLECAYIFGDDFEAAFDSGDFKRTIGCAKSSSTVFSAVINEIVTEAVTEIYCRAAALQKSEELGITGTGELYDKYIQSDDVFRAQFVTVNSSAVTEESTDNDDAAQRTVRCILAVYVMIGTALAAAKTAEDREKGIYRGNYVCVLSAGIIMSAAAELINSIIYGFDIISTAHTAAYCLAVCGFAACMGRLGKYFVYGMLPVLVIGSAAVCPVFFDITEAVPAVKAAAWIFPPKWCFESIECCAAAAVLINTAGIFLSRICGQYR